MVLVRFAYRVVWIWVHDLAATDTGVWATSLSVRSSDMIGTGMRWHDILWGRQDSRRNYLETFGAVFGQGLFQEKYSIKRGNDYACITWDTTVCFFTFPFSFSPFPPKGKASGSQGLFFRVSGSELLFLFTGFFDKLCVFFVKHVWDSLSFLFFVMLLWTQLYSFLRSFCIWH
ncbi:uncharacterized protein BDZ99DRAFT_158298 [Mytilinidion resinicola]|uniref:Uncharacterized protein n=1 Tax=Mytilinidion resinicola TaxID=574789 RepID=A0A6A6Y5U3_9PEZI|nr:uncharacterized protein BDZ99DRAFT_158298 [Mytilinidion resinicola]KAF2804030.1 hypothetical protein BDZ99DRAFT_158298 [Mytilinidion resinicola]